MARCGARQGGAERGAQHEQNKIMTLKHADALSNSSEMTQKSRLALPVLRTAPQRRMRYRCQRQGASRAVEEPHTACTYTRLCRSGAGSSPAALGGERQGRVWRVRELSSHDQDRRNPPPEYLWGMAARHNPQGGLGRLLPKQRATIRRTSGEMLRTAPHPKLRTKYEVLCVRRTASSQACLSVFII